MELIDKEKVIAEIEKRMQELHPTDTHKMQTGEKLDRDVLMWLNALTWVKGILDSIKTKEVDLENLFRALPEKIVDEKSHQVYELSIYHYDGQCVVDYVGEIEHDSLYAFSGNTLYEAIEKAWNWLSKNSTGG